MSFRRFIIMSGCVIVLLPAVAIAKAPKSTVCESFSGQLETCEIRTINGIALKRRLSKDRCIEGESFGIYRQDQMWVDNGCRGEFVSRRFGNEVFTRPGAATPRGQGYQAQPWVNPDQGRTTGSWQNPNSGQQNSPGHWAFLAGVAYAMNRERGIDDTTNTRHIRNELSSHGVDPNAIQRGGPLRNDFLRGLRSRR